MATVPPVDYSKFVSNPEYGIESYLRFWNYTVTADSPDTPNLTLLAPFLDDPNANPE